MHCAKPACMHASTNPQSACKHPHANTLPCSLSRHAENTSPVSRHSYTLHFVEKGLPWAPDNWAQRPADLPFEPLFVE